MTKSSSEQFFNTIFPKFIYFRFFYVLEFQNPVQETISHDFDDPVVYSQQTIQNHEDSQHTTYNTRQSLSAQTKAQL